VEIFVGVQEASLLIETNLLINIYEFMYAISVALDRIRSLTVLVSSTFSFDCEYYDSTVSHVELYVFVLVIVFFKTICLDLINGHHFSCATRLLCILAFNFPAVVPALTVQATPTVTLKVNASNPGRQMPSTLFGLFFEVCIIQSTVLPQVVFRREFCIFGFLIHWRTKLVLHTISVRLAGD